MVKIQQIVNKVAIDEKYDMIILRDAIVYRLDAVDISDKVITVLSNPAG